MRDLTVATTHTYYVIAGASPVLVHNCDTDYKNVALGIRKQGLREVADEKGYTHFLDDTREDALANVRDVANNHPNATIHVRLDGFKMTNGRTNASPAELDFWEVEMRNVAIWEREFDVWDFSVSYSRLLLRSLHDSSPSRVDVLFSNVRMMHLSTQFERLRIDVAEGRSYGGIEFPDPVKGNWYVINEGQSYVFATHC